MRTFVSESFRLLWAILLHPKTVCILLMIYEYYMFRQRSDILRAVFDRAVARCRLTGKQLLILGETPEDASGIPSKVISESDLTDASVLIDDDTVLFESSVFETMNDTAFDNVKETLRMKSPNDLFFVHSQPYAILTWLCTKTQDRWEIPKRVFIFYPPFYKFVYPVTNPMKTYEKHLWKPFLVIICYAFAKTVFSLRN